MGRLSTPDEVEERLRLALRMADQLPVEPDSIPGLLTNAMPAERIEELTGVAQWRLPDFGTGVAHSKAGRANVPAPWPDAPEPHVRFPLIVRVSPERVTKANGESGAPRR